MAKTVAPCVGPSKCSCKDTVNCKFEGGKNTMLCPGDVKHGVMLRMVAATIDGLTVETYSCMQKKCDRETIVYSGGKDLNFKIRNHYGVK